MREKARDIGWKRAGSGELKGTAGKQGVRRNRAAIGTWEYKLPGAKAIALEKNVKSWSKKEKM